MTSEYLLNERNKKIFTFKKFILEKDCKEKLDTVPCLFNGLSL